MRKQLLPLMLVSSLLSACPDDEATERETNSDAAVDGLEPNDAGTAAPPSTYDAKSLNTDYEAWQARMDKLRSCGLLGQGEWPFDPQLDLRCESLCILAASCDDLETVLCDYLPVQSLENCFDLCTSDDISCGDGTKAPGFSACDLVSDCESGEDESHCETFRCKDDGQIIGSYYLCDGAADCSDGSDEEDCALLCGAPRVMGL